MRTSAPGCATLLLAGLTLGCLHAPALPIPGLFNTGVDNNNALLVSGSVDPHYRLRQSPDTGYPGPNAYAVNDSGFPIGPWLANGPASKWIAPMANQSTGNAPGDYIYRLTFDLTGLDPATAVVNGLWSSDNEGTAIFLNGTPTGLSNAGNFVALDTLFSLSSGFVDGTNTLDFVVNNASTSVNPTGLRVELSGTADALPPPGTPASILKAPLSQTNVAGDPVTFSVTAGGARPLSYQWRLDSQPIPGATLSSYAISSVTASNAGAYDVVVTNAWGAVTSTPPATLTLIYPSTARLSYEAPGPSSRRTGLAVTEIMYNPPLRTDGRQLEFIELYNSNPFPEDISGYRLSGAWDYTFPENTSIAGLGYLVIAGVPADVQAVYGLTGVLGGFTNSLPNGDGTLRLRKRSGAVLLEINYSDQPPWPVAADGAGHSLVLARPSLGENNPRAWAASAVMGGSPGTADPTTTSPLDNIVLNEFLARSNTPSGGYVELYNHSPVPVDVGGCVLTDDPTLPKYVIPSGLKIGGAGFLQFRETDLTFAPSPLGGRLYLVSPARDRVIDVVSYEPQETGVACGRYPDGAEEFYRQKTPTPGAANDGIRLENVVLNELMYNPLSGDDDDQYVELYNAGTNSVSLAGWRLAGGVGFVFPASTVLAPDGYLVVARNALRLSTNYPNLTANNLLGDFTGKLSHGGERVVLTKPGMLLVTNTTGMVATNSMSIPVDEVTYGTGGRWGKWSDGGGSSLELINPRSNHRLAANWADSDETAKAEWSTVETAGVLDLGHPEVPTADQLQVLLQGPGEALLDNVQVLDASGNNRVANSTFDYGTAGWIPQGNHRLSSWETNSAFAGRGSLHVRAGDKGNQMVDRVRAPFTSALSPGQTATIRAKARWLRGWPEVLLRLKGGYLEAIGRLAVPPNLGTPGARNSQARTNAAPAIYTVSHRPTLPQAGQSIRVTARVEDSDGLQSVNLKYRLDPSTTLTTVPMHDDGSQGDLLAGDGIYTGLIPGQPAGTLIAFQIEATDSFNVPAASRFPSDAPVRECLVRVGETLPAGAFTAYRFWITKASFDAWAAREKMSGENLDATFVYGANRAVYNIGARYGGSIYTAAGYDTPTGTLCRYDLDFPGDDRLLGETRVVLDWPVRDPTDQREQLMMWFLEQFGLPNHYRRYIHLFVNGVRRGVVCDDIQKPGADPVNEWFPDDSNGSLFKTDVWDEFDDAGYRIGSQVILNSLQNFTTTGGVRKTARYRWNWEPRVVHGTANDFSDLFALVDAVNAPAANYQPAVESVVSVEHWMKTFCMNDLASYWDGFGNPNGKNTYLYKPQNSRWKLMSYDMDVGLGVFNDPVDAPLFPTLEDPTMNRLYAFPAFVRHYWRAMDRALNTFFITGAGTRIDALLDAKYAALQANGIALEGPDSIKSWIAQRRAFLQGQLAGVAANFSVSTPPVTISNTNLVTLTGTAPVQVETIAINGIPYPVTWTSVTAWRILVPLTPGTNVLAIAGWDDAGLPLTNATATATIRYTGSFASPENSIVINEIMSDPRVPGASFVELYNRSTNCAFDLSGWRLNGLSYTFPPGAIITNQQYLLLASDPKAFGTAYGWNIPVAHWYDGELQGDGETLSLLRPGTNLTELLVTRVRYQPGPPWPAGAAGTGASFQLVDAAQDNWRAGNWAVALTNSGASGPKSATPGAANSLTAALPPFPPLWLNELQPENLTGITNAAGGRTAWIEIHNPGSNVVSLSGLYLGNTYDNPTQWVFAAGASLNPGQFLPVFADGLTNLNSASEIHTSFALSNQSGALVLSRLNQGKIQVLDFLDYTNLLPNYSFGSYPDGQSFDRQAFYYATPGAPNNAGTAPLTLRINEWMAGNTFTLLDPATSKYEDWFEIYNYSSNQVDLSGCYLSHVATNRFEFKIPAGYSVPPHGFLLVWADKANTDGWPDLHVDFHLSKAGTSILLSSPNGSLLDFVTFGPQVSDVGMGRYPDGTPNIFILPAATPATNNIGPNTAPVLANPGTQFLFPGQTLRLLAHASDAEAPAQSLSYSLEGSTPAGAAIDPTSGLFTWTPGPDRTGTTNPVVLKVTDNGVPALSATATFDIVVLEPPVFAATRLPGETLSLVWPSVPGQLYRVEYAESLAAPVWVPLGADQPGTGSPLYWEIDLSLPGPRFYRLGIVRE